MGGEDDKPLPDPIFGTLSENRRELSSGKNVQHAGGFGKSGGSCGMKCLFLFHVTMIAGASGMICIDRR